MLRLPPRSNTTDTLFPYPPHFRSIQTGNEERTARRCPAILCARRPPESASCIWQKNERVLHERGSTRGCGVAHVIADTHTKGSRYVAASADRKSTRMNSSH